MHTTTVQGSKIPLSSFPENSVKVNPDLFTITSFFCIIYGDFVEYYAENKNWGTKA